VKNDIYYEPLSSEQFALATNMFAFFERWTAVVERLDNLRGGMHWKTVAGKQYLFRTRDRYGNGQSFGPRNPDTENLYYEFRRDKSELKEKEKALRKKIVEQAALCRAAGVGRAPRVITAIARNLWRQGYATSAIITGNAAMYAYESACGVRFVRGSSDLSDYDPMFEAKSFLKLIVLRVPGLNRLGPEKGADFCMLRRFSGAKNPIDAISKADRSFVPEAKGSSREMRNKAGYRVEVVESEVVRPESPYMLTGERTFVNLDHEHQGWFVNKPWFKQTVIGEDGFPAPFVVADPRIFALNKYRLSFDAGRGTQAISDRKHAIMVAQVLVRYMPHLSFNDPEIEALPCFKPRGALPPPEVLLNDKI